MCDPSKYAFRTDAEWTAEASQTRRAVAEALLSTFDANAADLADAEANHHRVYMLVMFDAEDIMLGLSRLGYSIVKTHEAEPDAPDEELSGFNPAFVTTDGQGGGEGGGSDA